MCGLRCGCSHGTSINDPPRLQSPSHFATSCHLSYMHMPCVPPLTFVLTATGRRMCTCCLKDHGTHTQRATSGPSAHKASGRQWKQQLGSWMAVCRAKGKQHPSSKNPCLHSPSISRPANHVTVNSWQFSRTHNEDATSLT